MRNQRYKWFLITIVVGFILGLILGWSVFPRKASEMPIDQLRMDYQIDYVLMVAETYQKEGDLLWARTQLEYLYGDEYLDGVQDAVGEARNLQHDLLDLQMMDGLLIALEEASWRLSGKGAG